MRRIFVSAGEPSGDRHAASVIRALRETIPELVVHGIGGSDLARSGAELLEQCHNLSAMGLVEVLGTIPAHWRLLRAVDRRIASEHYDVALLVDYPGFNLRLAEILSARGVPVIYYIAPQLWAWGRWRVATLRRCVRHLAVILPFEEPFFRAHRVPSTFVSHPLLDDPHPPCRIDARRRLGIGATERVLAVFPGSRSGERRRHWAPFQDTARRLRDQLPDVQVVVAGWAEDLSPVEGFRYHDDAQTVLAAADAALCKSGTSTLQSALADVPMVIAYRMHPLSFAVARRVVRVPHIGLVNLVAQRDIAPECLQRQAHPDILGRWLVRLLEQGGSDAAYQRSWFPAVRSALGTPGAAHRVAELALAHAA